MAVKSSAEEPLVLHFLGAPLSPFELLIKCPWCSSSKPETPNKFPTPTKFGRRSSIMLFCGQALKFSCRLKMAGKMLNCWCETSSVDEDVDVATGADGELPSAPRQDETPLKSTAKPWQTFQFKLVPSKTRKATP